MIADAGKNGWTRGTILRLAGWGLAASILLLPLIAMRFTGEVNWGAGDFIFAGILIGGTGLLLELAVRRAPGNAYRAGAAIALVAAFLLIWANAAVGIIGSEDNPLNLLYGGVIAIGMVGVLASRFRPGGMACAMAAMASAQAMVALAAYVAGYVTFILNGVFVAIWLLSAWLFSRAAR